MQDKITQIFHLFKLLSGGWFAGGWGDVEVWGVSWLTATGGGKILIGCSFLSLGTAGNDPLLLLVGRAMIFGGPVPSQGEGAAARFGDSSASFRRTTFSVTVSGSNSPTDLQT